MNMCPLVSIIVPVYKTEKYIRACVESIIAQTFKDYETILVDDGSPDGCPAICDEYVEQYSNFKVIHKTNGGLSSARNIGVKNALGKYILFIDSDDTIERNLLEEVVNKAEETQAQVTIFGIHTMVFRNGILQSEKFGNHNSDLYENRTTVQNHFSYMCDDGMWNQVYDKLYLKSVLTENDIYADHFYDRVCEDTVFLLDLFPVIDKICIVEGCYYNYYIRNTQSVVTTFIPERYEKYYGKFLKMQNVVRTINGGEREEQLLYMNYCVHIMWAYEFMFHPDCKYSLIDRYFYMKKLFSIRKEKKEFCAQAYDFFLHSKIAEDTSGSTKKVVANILKKRYFFAWCYHCFALFKARSSRTV